MATHPNRSRRRNAPGRNPKPKEDGRRVTVQPIMKPIADNLPEKLTAHAVRRLRVCSHCKGIGDGEQMISRREGVLCHFHTGCYVKHFGFDAVMGLPSIERDKFRMCDLSVPQMRKLLISESRG